MKKYALIKQPAGLGDIIFCQKIALKIIEKYNYSVIWPVIEEYKDTGNYLDERIWFPCVNDLFPGKNYYTSRSIIDNEDVLFLPLQEADSIILDRKIFQCKYDLVNLTYDDWVDFVNIRRNKTKEDFLYYNELKLKDNEKYILVSDNYGSLPSIKQYNLCYPEDKRVVHVKPIPGYNLFDWCKVIENADSIHTVASSINILMEKLDTRDVYMASRHKGDWSEVEYIFTKPFTKIM